MPHGFESGLRYLAPGPRPRPRPAARPPRRSATASPRRRRREASGPAGADATLDRRPPPGGGLLRPCCSRSRVGYPVQRHYLRDRYANPTFTTPGLNAAFAWATPLSDARIATTSTRQYPLFGTDLSNRVQFVGEERPHGGFVAPSTCRAWRRLLDEGDYDYVVASRDRIEPGKPPYPPTARWTEGPGATVVLRKPPTVVFSSSGPLDPSACSS